MYETFTVYRRADDVAVGSVAAQSRAEAVYRLAGGSFGRDDYYARSEADERAHARLSALDDLTKVYEQWLADPAQAPLQGIQGDAEELHLHAAEMALATDLGAEERALRGATRAQALVWREWLSVFISRWNEAAR